MDTAELNHKHPITPRQQQILDFIVARMRDNLPCPTIREIGAHFGIKSPNGVIAHVRSLEKKGYLVRDGFRARSFRVPSSGGIHAIAAGDCVAIMAGAVELDRLDPERAEALAESILTHLRAIAAHGEPQGIPS